MCGILRGRPVGRKLTSGKCVSEVAFRIFPGLVKASSIRPELLQSVFDPPNFFGYFGSSFILIGGADIGRDINLIVIIIK